jgi:putative NADH-flavin reductase
MKIALFGATGAVGGYFLNKALAAGHEVTALVRSPEKLGAQPHLRAVKGDVTDASDVHAVIDQADVVVSCLGNVKGVLIMEKAAEAILQAAGARPNPPKCLFVSSIGCGGSSWIVLQLLRLINGRAGFADYERADARITREANVPYVLIRPAALKEKPGNGKYRVFQGDGTFARPMAKEDVAAFLFDAVGSDQWDGKGGFQLAGCKSPNSP